MILVLYFVESVLSTCTLIWTSPFVIPCAYYAWRVELEFLCVAPNTAPVYSKNLFKTAFCFSVCECMAQVWRVFHQTLFSGVLFAARPHGVVTTGCAEPEQTHLYSLYRVCVHCRTLAIRGKGPKKEANLSNQAQWIFLHSRSVVWNSPHHELVVLTTNPTNCKYNEQINPRLKYYWLLKSGAAWCASC